MTYSVTLSMCDGDSQVCGFTDDFDCYEDAFACFQEYAALDYYGSEPFDLFLEKDSVDILRKLA